MNGNPKGAGRHNLYGNEKMKSHTVRTTEAQWAKLEHLGGAQWLRNQIDRASATLDKMREQGLLG